MTQNCPTCGHAYSPDKLAVDLTRNEVFFGGKSAKVNPSEAEMLAALVKAHPQALLHDRIIHALWGQGNAPDGAGQTIKVYASRLRPPLRAMGWDIRAVWGQGYMVVRLPQSHEAAA